MAARRRNPGTNSCTTNRTSTNHVEGDYGNLRMDHSLSTWLDLHPTIKAVSIVGASLAAGAVLAQRTGEGRKIEAVVQKNVEEVLNR